MALVAELRRRGVLHVAGLYLVAAWIAIEVTATVFPLLLLPEWTSRAVVILAILGLPVALVLAWAFDLTPEGVRRAERGPAGSGAPSPSAGRLALVALTVLLTGVAGWGARGLWLGPRADEEAPTLNPARVAVLYFDDFSEGSRLGYLADGLTEALIHELAQLEPLEVVSRNGVKPFRAMALPLDSVARALGAGMIVEGSVEGMGERLIATVQLIDGRTGIHLLSRRLERSGEDVLALRDELVREAARTIGQTLGRELEVERDRRGTRSADAWEAVQRARSFMADADTLRWALGDLEASMRALGRADTLLDRAARLDPRWSEPTLLRAEVVRDMAVFGALTHQRADAAGLRRGIALTETVLEREPGNAEARALRGAIRYQLTWQGGDSVPALLRAAESDFRAALAADSASVTAWVWLADLLRARGDFADASVAAERALAADPFLIHAEQRVLFTMGHIWLELEHFDRAARWAAEGRRRYPAEPAFAAQGLVLAAGWAGDQVAVDSAWAMVREVERGYGMEEWPHGHLQVAAVLARSGDADSARAVIAEVRTTSAPEPWLDYYEANARLQLGEEGRALELLDRFVTAVPHRRSYIASDWWWRPLRDTGRFRAMVAGA